MTIIDVVLVTLVLAALAAISYVGYQVQNLEAKLSVVFDRFEQQKSEVETILRHQQANLSHFEKLDQTIEAFKKELDIQRHKQDHNSSYKQALKMVEMGASLDEIVSTCSLTRAEAQLLINLRGYRTQQNVPHS